MNPRAYQEAASRTECDQRKSSLRMRGLVVGAHNSPSPEETNGEEYLVPIRLNHALLGICAEGGELFSQFQKWIYYGKPLDRTNIKEELGDVLWYVAEACNALGLDLGDVMTSNIAKLKARFPEKYTDERAADENRDRAAEAKAVGSPTPLENAKLGERFLGVTNHNIRPESMQPKINLPKGQYTCGCPFVYETSGQEEPKVVGFCPAHNHPIDTKSKKAEDAK